MANSRLFNRPQIYQSSTPATASALSNYPLLLVIPAHPSHYHLCKENSSAKIKGKIRTKIVTRLVLRE